MQPFKALFWNKKKNNVNGIDIGIGSTAKRKKIEEKINAWTAMYFFIRFYSDEEIVQKFSNSTELLAKKKFVGIFINVIYYQSQMLETAFLNLCKKHIEGVFGPIAKLKQNIEDGSKIKMPKGYENYVLSQLIRDNTAKFENIFDIWFYVIKDGVIDFSTQMVKNIENPFDVPPVPPVPTVPPVPPVGNKNSKSNTGLILGALSAFFLLR